MKHLWICFLFLLIACASNTVQMSPEETAQFLKQHPETSQALKAVQDPSIRSYRHTYQTCQGSQCYEIECRGIGEDSKCWKTPMTEVESNTVRLEALNKSLEKPEMSRSDYRESCLGNANSSSQRRQDCLTYLRFGINHSNGEYYQQVLNHLCNMKGSACLKDGKDYGKGSVGLGARRLVTEKFVIPNESSSNTYQVIVDTE